jgi:hypothetical protein
VTREHPGYGGRCTTGMAASVAGEVEARGIRPRKPELPAGATWPHGVDPANGWPKCGCGNTMRTADSWARGWCQRCQDDRDGRR